MAAAFISEIKTGLLLTALAACQASGQSPALLPPITVLAERQLGDEPSTPLAEWTREDLRQAAPRTIDEMLAKEPAFSL